MITFAQRSFIRRRQKGITREMGKKWISVEKTWIWEGQRWGLRRNELRKRTEKGAPCLRTTCGKSLRCETEKRVRSIVSSHVHMCVPYTHMHTWRVGSTRECVSSIAYAYARLFFCSVSDTSSCLLNSIWKLARSCRKCE